MSIFGMLSLGGLLLRLNLRGIAGSAFGLNSVIFVILGILNGSGGGGVSFGLGLTVVLEVIVEVALGLRVGTSVGLV